MSATTTLLRAAFYLSVAAIVYVSVLPAQALIETGVWDKLEHAAVYGASTLIGLAAYREPRHVRPVAGGLIVLGIVLEIVQCVVPGRYGEVADASANAIGVAAILLGRFTLHRLRTKA